MIDLISKGIIVVLLALGTIYAISLYIRGVKAEIKIDGHLKKLGITKDDVGL